MRRTQHGDQRGARGWRIGVDLGGTWVRVVATDADGRRRAATARSPGLDALPALLGAVWKRWRIARDEVAALVVASRGVWTAGERREQRRRLRGLARTVRAIPDAEAAHHAAFGGAPGVLILGGTGSMALGRSARGRWARAGGLGPLLGDDGSAFWIGREWLRTSPRPEDFRAARRLIGSRDAVARIAGLAPGVLRHASAGAPRARAIIRRAQHALADLVATTARRLRMTPPVRVSWGGSLLDVPAFRAGVWREARRLGLDVTPRDPARTTAAAAMDLAEAATQLPAAPRSVRRPSAGPGQTDSRSGASARPAPRGSRRAGQGAGRRQASRSRPTARALVRRDQPGRPGGASPSTSRARPAHPASRARRA